ncbi:MAG TPA: hypothetical protein VL979_14265 [Solirubrobacteraceae bacterium]|nr:hypothetical protein [Solirubrobacteraceae bacterium]
MSSARRHPRLRPWSCAALLSLGLLACLLVVRAAPARAAETYTHWGIETRPAPTALPLGGSGMVVVTIVNDGDQASSGSLEVSDQLPRGVHATQLAVRPKGYGSEPVVFNVCKIESAGEQVGCNYPQPLRPYEELVLEIYVSVEAHAATEAPEDENVVNASGGGVKEAERKPLDVGGGERPFGVESFEFIPENEQFERDEEAGSHPFQLTTVFNLNDRFEPESEGQFQPAGDGLEENLDFELPPGLIGNVNTVSQCSAGDFGAELGGSGGGANACPAETQVGVATVAVNVPEPTVKYDVFTEPVFNLVPPAGEPAQFGFKVDGVPVVLNTSVRTGGDYGVDVGVHYASDAVQIISSRVTFWGTPADTRHNTVRGWGCFGDGEPSYLEEHPCKPSEEPQGPPKAFLTLPTSCGPVRSWVSGNAWNGSAPTGAGIPVNSEGDALLINSKGETRVESENATNLHGCESLAFNPSLEVLTGRSEASTPTGTTVQVSLPQAGLTEPQGRSEQDIRETTLVLPAGLVSSPAAASGLGTCDVEEAGFLEAGLLDKEEAVGGALSAQLAGQEFTPLAATCPENAKIGTVNIETPVLKNELEGSLYLARQDTDPFSSPLVLYLIAEEPESEVLVKLAGEVQISATGQLTSVFHKTPQTPFERLTIHLTEGERASQSTPDHCGTYEAEATFRTWTGTTPAEEAAHPAPELHPAPADNRGFAITSGPGGSACPGATLGFSPGFSAGSANQQAGAFTPFTLTIEKPDGQQALESIDTTLPPGLAAKISEVTPCENTAAVESLPTLVSPQEVSEGREPCGGASKVGETLSYSGLGGKPVTLPGTLYLTRNVDGAPFGLLAVTEAKAGPFNLGDVNVLSTITINETTAAVTAKTVNPIPTILDGVPSQLKKIEIAVNRASFEFNPTNCEGLSIGGALGGSEGASSPLSYPFVVSGCGSLPFQPKLTASVQAQGSKANGTTFAVTIESPGMGQANIHKVDLTIPASLPSRLSTIQKACLESKFNVAPTDCDEESIIGEGTVYTPVFKEPLKGKAYLVAHGGAEFPDVEFVLYGEDGVKIVLDGKTLIKNGITYSKFESSPDAPFTKFESVFPAGPHSALTINVAEKEDYNLCKTTLTVPTEITAQSGVLIKQTTAVAELGCKGVKAFKATRAQKLKKALKQCRARYKHNKHKRLACERQARKRYAPTLKEALAACRHAHKHAKKQRVACEKAARKAHAKSSRHKQSHKR